MNDDYSLEELAPWVAENMRRFIAGEEMASVVSPGRDY